MFEAREHEANSFVTLTYDEAHKPADGSLSVRDWQLFAKRLRRAGYRFRFFMCGEYGEKTKRPHYHACLLGQDFAQDREPIRQAGGFDYFVSPTLAKAWDKGFHLIGNLTFDSAAYVARYVTKKVYGQAGDFVYMRVDSESGEIWFVKPEFALMSRGGRNGRGLGYAHFAKWRDELYDRDECVVGGKTFAVPRYFDSLLGEDDPERFEEVKYVRRQRVGPGVEDRASRDRDREKVLSARLKLSAKPL